VNAGAAPDAALRSEESGTLEQALLGAAYWDEEVDEAVTLLAEATDQAGPNQPAEELPNSADSERTQALDLTLANWD
jgi:hypothetical protein